MDQNPPRPPSPWRPTSPPPLNIGTPRTAFFAVNKHSRPDEVIQLLRQMRLNLNDPNYQESGLVCLFKYGSGGNSNNMLELGVGEAVLNAMRTHVGDVRVNTAGCSVMRLIGGNLFQFNQDGAGVKVYEAMANFQSDARLQAAACYAIRTLARCVANANFFISIKIAPLIATAMRDHADNEELQKAACGAIWCLCGATDGVSSKIWKCDLPKYVTDAMKNFEDSLKVQEYGTGALRSVGRPYSTVRLGGADAVLSALRNHKNHSRMVEYTFKAIKDFSELRANADVFLAKRASELIVECLMNHKGVERVQEIGCEVIWALIYWPEGRQMFLRDKVARVLSNILEDFNDARMFLNVTTLLRKFAETETAVREFLTLNMCAKLVMSATAAMQQGSPLKKDSPKVVREILKTLIVFSQSLPEARQIIYAEAEDLVNKILNSRLPEPYQEVSEQARLLADLII